MDSTERPLTPPTTASDRPLLGPFHKSLPKLAQQGNIQELVKVGEEEDLGGDARDQDDPSRLFIIAPLVLGYLILDDLPPARYALTRLPHVLANHILPQALFSLLAATWGRKHASVYQRSQELADVVSTPAFFSQPLATLVRSLNERFIDEFRERAFALISRAYTSISLPLIQTYLGPLPVDKILSVAQQKGWSYDAAGQILSPGKLLQRDIGTGIFAPPSTLTTFHSAAKGAADLESIL